MNDRIKELAEQSGAGWDDKYHWYVGNEQMKKFAELIMTECVVALAPDVKSEDDAVTINNMVQKVKQHFGIEE